MTIELVKRVGRIRKASPVTAIFKLKTPLDLDIPEEPCPANQWVAIHQGACAPALIVICRLHLVFVADPNTA
jgi:hypothetical protein